MALTPSSPSPVFRVMVGLVVGINQDDHAVCLAIAYTGPVDHDDRPLSPSRKYNIDKSVLPRLEGRETRRICIYLDFHENDFLCCPGFSFPLHSFPLSLFLVCLLCLRFFFFFFTR